MIQIDRLSPEPIPMQIKRAVADLVRSGLMQDGEQLPPVRRLARELGISPVTVVQAYAALESAGLADRRQGLGVFVRAKVAGPLRAAGSGRETATGMDRQAAAGECREQTGWQQGLVDYIPRSVSWSFQAREPEPGLIQMQTAVVSADLLPIPDLVNDLRAAILSDPQLLGRYSPLAGLHRLRSAAAAYISTTGLPLEPEQVMITQGAQQGIDLVARTFVGPGDAVAVEALTYPPAIDAFRARGARIYPIPVDGEGMQVDPLEEIPGLKLVYTVPAYQNPLGVVMSRRRRLDLLDLARERRLLVVEDDPWREISFEKTPPPPLKAQDSGGHVIYLKSFGKLVAVGLRVGALVASGRVFQRLLAAKEVVDRGTALLPQVALQALLDSPRMGRHMRRLTLALRERRDRLIRELEAQAPRGVRWTVPQGGLSVWVSLPPQMDTEALLPIALQRGLAFAPGAGFFPAEPQTQHLRLSYGLGAPQELARGVSLLCDLLRERL
ncbi:MAG: PLP-dependent aminotransferase family protein [Bacillota bacterium]